MRRISRSRGSVHPFSHRLTVREETPSAAAVSREVSERSCMALDSQPAKVAPSPSVSSARGDENLDPDLSPLDRDPDVDRPMSGLEREVSRSAEEASGRARAAGSMFALSKLARGPTPRSRPPV